MNGAEKALLFIELLIFSVLCLGVMLEWYSSKNNETPAAKLPAEAVIEKPPQSTLPYRVGKFTDGDVTCYYISTGGKENLAALDGGISCVKGEAVK